MTNEKKMLRGPLVLVFLTNGMEKFMKLSGWIDLDA